MPVGLPDDELLDEELLDEELLDDELLEEELLELDDELLEDELLDEELDELELLEEELDPSFPPDEEPPPHAASNSNTAPTGKRLLFIKITKNFVGVVILLFCVYQPVTSTIRAESSCTISNRIGPAC